MFTKFCQYAQCRFRVKEGDVQSLSPFARGLVDQTDAFRLGVSQSVGDTVLNSEGYMVYTCALVLDKFCDCTIRTCRLQQFQLRVTDLQEGCPYLLVFHYFDVVTLQSQDLLIIRQRLFDAFHGNAQMLNVRNLHSSMFYLDG